jgi:protein involved in polysaccharide export with SLBB domain
MFEAGTPAVFDRVVSRDGDVRLPYAGKVRVAGLFPLMAQREVARACAEQQILARPRPRVRVERIDAPAAPSGEDGGDAEREDDGDDTGEDRITYGDWLGIRTWAGAPPRETRYVLRVAADGKVRFPGAGLLNGVVER